MTDPQIREATRIVEAASNARPAVIRSFFDEDTFTVTHVISDPATARAAIIDSVLDFDPASGRTSFASADKVIDYIRSEGLEVEWLLETHAHADHLSAAPYIKAKTGAWIGIGEHIRDVQKIFRPVFAFDDLRTDGSDFDRLFADGERFALGTLEVEVMHTPGHTPADLTYRIGDAAFVGDTLFMPDYGTARADFPGGDARVLYRSVRRLLSLPEASRLFLCHDYKAPGRDTYVWETTVAQQRRANVHIHDGVSEDEFAAMREARDATLDMPRLILPSIQVNMRGGHFPEPEENGVSYLKLPLNRL